MVLPSRRPLPLSDIPLASLLVLPQQCAMFAVHFYVPLLRHMRAISGAHVCPLEYHLISGRASILRMVVSFDISTKQNTHAIRLSRTKNCPVWGCRCYRRHAQHDMTAIISSTGSSQVLPLETSVTQPDAHALGHPPSHDRDVRSFFFSNQPSGKRRDACSHIPLYGRP